jgi:nucleotide-binding universal stress UspA family protein
MGRRHSQFKRILIGFDGSSQAEKATEIGLSLAQSLDSKVLLFSVARPPEPATMVELSAMLDDAREHFEEKFKKMVQRAKELNVELSTDIAVGHPVEQIVHRAETDKIDLIVLGRRGMSKFEKMIVGYTSEKVIRYAHCPVMVVR